MNRPLLLRSGQIAKLSSYWLIGSLALLFVLLARQAAWAQTPPFHLHDSTAEADFTTSQAWGDFDRDGDLDLAVGNGMLTKEEMLAALDDANLTIQCKNDLFNVITTLLNKHKADLSKAIRAQIDGIQIHDDRRNRLYCNENGVLQACLSLPENDFTTSLAWGDADSDGDLDLAVGNNSLGLLVNLELHIPLINQITQCTVRSTPPGVASYLYRNDTVLPGGAPTFTLNWIAPHQDATTGIAWGDYDNDGQLDLALANSKHYFVINVVIDQATFREIMQALESGVLEGLEEQIRKTIQPPDYESEPQANRVYHNVTLTNSLDSQFRFALALEFEPIVEKSFAVAWVDVNNDQQLDLAFTNVGPERVYCNLVDAAGQRHLQSCWQSLVDDMSTSLSWGDVDGNGLPDLAVGNIGHLWAGAVNRLYLNQGMTNTNSATPTLLLHEAWTSAEADGTVSVAFGDADGDGYPDLAVGNGNFDANQKNRLYCNETQPDGGHMVSKVACWSAREADVTTSIAWGDMDGDGDLDLAAGNISVPVGQQNRFYRNDRAQLTGNFAAWSQVPANDSMSVAWADVNGDQRLDLTLGIERGVQIFSGLGRGLANVPTVLANNDAIRSLAWGDMDNDHRLDLVVGNERGTPNRLYRNVTPVGTLTPTFELAWEFGVAMGAADLAWGDYDGDGDLDLAVGNSSYTPLEILVGGRSQIYRNNGLVADQPHFTLVWESDEEDATRSVAWGDVDGDGDLDLAVGNSASPNHIYRNDGAQDPLHLNFTLAWSAPQTNDTHSIAWGDMNSDGKLDLAVGNTTQSSRVYCNQSSATPNRQVRLEECWQSVEGERTRSIAWGDVDGDGDLDLAVGNQEAPEQLYVNIGKTLSFTPVWTSKVQGMPNNQVDRSFTRSVAWGDADGDGDLDLAAGNAGGQPSGIYLNRGRNSNRPQDDQPFVAVYAPGQTPGAPFFATAEVIRATTPISIPYRLFSYYPQSSVRIIPEYSTNGGGLWLPATPADLSTAAVDLSASPWPTGTEHFFAWDAARDLIKSDNVVFRIRTQNIQTHSPILWPATGSQSPPFRMEAPWYVRVIDAKGQSVANAEVYADGKFITYTNAAGLVGPQAIPPQQRKNLVALAPQLEQPATRSAHPGGWSYRIYQTTLAWQEDGVAQPYTPTLVGEQRLTTAITMPLVLFNLVVSLEWSADVSDTQQIADAIHQASDYLYDLTDGQMAFGEVTIYTNAQHWAAADIQVAAKNTVHPYAYIGGIASSIPSEVIHIGRAWNGDQGNDGDWSNINGFRTITHEFGHYALHLYDEYFGYTPVTEARDPTARCVGNRDAAKDAVGASAMDYQYTNSEFSDQNLAPQLWGGKCQFSAQYVRTKGESAWDTLVSHYQDGEGEENWRFVKPSAPERRKVIAGPTDLPNGLPDWPEITIIGAAPIGPKLALTVRNAAGPFADAGVTLYKASSSVAIDQGRTDPAGRLAIFGAGVDDVLYSSSIDGALAGNLTLTTTQSATLTLSPVHKTFAAFRVGPAAPLAAPSPYLRIMPKSVAAAQSPVTLSYVMQNFDPPSAAQSALTVIVTEPGQETAHFAQAAYRDDEQRYTGQIRFAATPGANIVQVIGAVANDIYYLHASYQVQRVQNDSAHIVFSTDGRVRLDLNAGAFPGAETYVVINTQNAAPGPISTTLTLVGGVYDITASGSVTTLQQPTALTIAYDPATLTPDTPIAALGLYWWDANMQTWDAAPVVTPEPDQHALTAQITSLGAYAVMAKP